MNILLILLREKRILSLIAKIGHLRGHSFNEQALEELGVTFSLSNTSLQNIPSEGRVIIAANHPLGGLDGLLLLRAVSLVRQDVKVLANSLLTSIDNLNDVLLSADIFGKKNMKSGVEAVRQALNKEEAVIIFPAGEVSRLGWDGVKDAKWKKGVVYFSRLGGAPILPVHISGRNSILFYLLSIISQPLSFLRLISELFNKSGKNFHITIGSLIPAGSSTQSSLLDKPLATRLRKHIYLTGKGKPGLFRSEATVASPEGRALLRKELFAAPCLTVREDKFIFKVQAQHAPITMREIARLRELTFRKAGEGTGLRRDFDKYDMLYDHLILWNDKDLEIMGSYRLGKGSLYSLTNSEESLYTGTLFNFTPGFIALLPEAIELGRSFIQERYWKSNALDLLWSGIAAYIKETTGVRYLFGPVSLSAAFPDDMKLMLVYYFEKWYKLSTPYALPRLPVEFIQKDIHRYKEIFDKDSAKEDMKVLKQYMKVAGFTIPVLFRQYIELCEEGGVSFSGFNIDPLFNNCIDGFIMLDLNFLKSEKRERYFKESARSSETTVA